jgi:hypothetical protein
MVSVAAPLVAVVAVTSITSESTMIVVGSALRSKAEAFATGTLRVAAERDDVVEVPPVPQLPATPQNV